MKSPFRDLAKAEQDKHPEHRLEALVSSIRACAAARGDSDANRDELIAESLGLNANERAEMTKHFEEEAAIWAAATGQPELRDFPAIESHRSSSTSAGPPADQTADVIPRSLPRRSSPGALAEDNSATPHYHHETPVRFK